jgi:hypothetical protein
MNEFGARIPFLLFDCLGFPIPLIAAAVAVICDMLLLLVLGAGRLGDAFIAVFEVLVRPRCGEPRNIEDDEIVIVSIQIRLGEKYVKRANAYRRAKQIAPAN